MTAPSGSDIPPAAGNVVRRSLEAEIGVTRLDQLVGWSRRELLAVHGIGPKGVRILEEALATRGLALKQDA